jgi:hypothetical protein
MSCSLAYIRPHPRSFEVAGVCEKPLTSEEVLQAIEEHIDHILRFSTSFESVSARIISRESERARR